MSLAALALPKHGSAVPYGTRADVPYGCGNVDAQAIVAGMDRASGRPVHAVRVANNSEHPLQLRVVSDRGSSRTLELAPFSIVESLLPSPAGDGAQVRISGAGLSFCLDVPAVPRRRATSPFAGIVVACAGMGILVASLLAASAAPALQRALASPSPTPRVVVRTRTVERRVVQRPLIEALELPDAAVAGSTLHVHAVAHAAGSAYLLNDAGGVLTQAPLSPRGDAVLRVPVAAAGRTVRIVASVASGSRHAQMSAALVVMPNSQISAAFPSAAPVPTSAPPSVPSNVIAGSPIVVRLHGRHNEALVSLMDGAGAVIEQLDVAPNETDVSLHAPAVDAPTTYEVVVSITRGHAQEETLRAVRVTPTSE